MKINRNELPYMDKNLPIQERVNDLLSRMSVEEKVGQMRSFAAWEHKEENEWLHGNCGHYRIGNREHAKENVQDNNRVVEKVMEDNRWGIPPLRHDEALHGLGGASSTCYPVPTAMAATFDNELIAEMCYQIGKETALQGIFQVLSPVANITRDIRWGRAYETYGEDPYLASRMTVAFVKGMEENKVIATPKHFVCNVGDGGRDSYEVPYSERHLREIFLPPFEAGVKEGGARGIMPAYNAVDGIPCHHNDWLLTKVLREEWGFDGIVVSDYGGIFGGHWRHLTSMTADDNFGDAYKAGLDVDLPDGGKEVLKLVENGTIPMELLDTITARVLKVKFECGLFDTPFTDEDVAQEYVHCENNIKTARKVANEAMVLLKNENNTLPIKNAKKIGLFGPAANYKNIGGYSRCEMPWDVTPYEGIKALVGDKIDIVLHTEGDPASVAKDCDVAIFFATIVESEGMDRNNTDLPVLQGGVNNEYRHINAEDEINVNMIVNTYNMGVMVQGDQEAMIKAIAATGVPTVVCLVIGSPITMDKWIKDVSAVLLPWYGGEQGGHAIAETLFGLNNPAGRTPFTFPKNKGQLPLYYNFAPSGRGYDYWDDDGKPMFPFGHGLSYTTFEYSDLKLTEKAKAGEKIVAKFKVKNTGTVKGDEVCQLYIHDMLSSVAKPMIELKGYKRVTLKAGETKEVSIELTTDQLKMWNRQMQFVLELGEFEVKIGASCVDIRLEGKFFVVE